MVLATGDETIRALTSFATEHRMKATQFTAIGAFSRVVVAYFDWATRKYRHVPIDEQVEVLSLVGDITLEGDAPKIHAHASSARRTRQPLAGTSSKGTYGRRSKLC